MGRGIKEFIIDIEDKCAAVERLDKNDPKNDIDLNSLIEKEGFDKKELMELKDDIEFEVL